MRKRNYYILLFVCLLCVFQSAVSVTARPLIGGVESSASEEDTVVGETSELMVQYQEYEQRFAAIEERSDIVENGFDIIKYHEIPVVFETFGEEEVTFILALDRQYARMVIFIADKQGTILYKTNQLETNNRCLGEMKQPTKGSVAISFQDVNKDGLTDIIMITNCENSTGDYAGKSYKIGDVLFQGEKTFYRDYRISDKLNRFSMNKSIACIVAYVRDGISTEVLYTASTLKELTDQNFKIIQEQCYWRDFEKQGRLQVVPGVMCIAEYNIFMIYLVNEQGNIVWSFQPMGDYANLYSLKGMTGRDMDGDGMKDLVVLARYSNEGPDGKPIVESDCAIYYQRTTGFDVDTEFKKFYKCTEEDTLEKLVKKIRKYWGWPQDND
ncbi:VCBS repeat-containing protein [Anaerosporobacter sp.]|uniref:VCBS repeat-containing protein n=1 Tax=Anaerosporobacter sp. TaxID=1872529 RepID=UPI00286EF99E|nr:VCBS repeat-containing protein [Anaerosporobacter sp.]